MLCRTSLGKCVMAFVSFAAALLTLGPLAALAQAKELKIGVQYGLGYLPLYVARDAGLLDKHMKVQGLEPVPMRIFNFTGGPQIQDGLLSQSLDIGAGGVVYFALGHCHTPAVRADRPADPTTPPVFHGAWDSDGFVTLLRNTIAWGVGG